MAKLLPETALPESEPWDMYVDKSSNVKGGRACIIVEGPNRITLEQSIELNFPTNNIKAEYEALIAGLKLA